MDATDRPVSRLGTSPNAGPLMPLVVTISDGIEPQWMLEVRNRGGEDYDVSLFRPGATKPEVRAEVLDFLDGQGPVELARRALNEVRAVVRAREFHERERDRVDWQVGS
jgi:hypothetical protein